MAGPIPFHLNIYEAHVEDHRPTSFAKAAIPIFFLDDGTVRLRLSEDVISDLPHTPSVPPNTFDDGPESMPRIVRIGMHQEAREVQEGSYVYGSGLRNPINNSEPRPEVHDRYSSTSAFTVAATGSSERFRRIEAALQRILAGLLESHSWQAAPSHASGGGGAEEPISQASGESENKELIRSSTNSG